MAGLWVRAHTPTFHKVRGENLATDCNFRHKGRRVMRSGHIKRKEPSRTARLIYLFTESFGVLHINQYLTKIVSVFPINYQCTASVSQPIFSGPFGALHINQYLTKFGKHTCLSTMKHILSLGKNLLVLIKKGCIQLNNA